jgi:hypothetical protein
MMTGTTAWLGHARTISVAKRVRFFLKKSTVLILKKLKRLKLKKIATVREWRKRVVVGTPTVKAGERSG